MATQILAMARTPWTRRHGPLAATHPEHLLGVALIAAIDRAELGWDDVDLVLVACDAPVGAQAATVGRRVLDALGAETTAAATIEAAQVGDLLALELASHRRGVTVVAAVESTSIVAPGAALVRDYGRPTTLGSPEVDWLERVAVDAGLDRGALDGEAGLLRMPVTPPEGVLTPVATGHRTTVSDDLPPEPVPPDAIDPLRGGDGVLTAAHQAGLADGAAAVVVGPGPGRPLRSVTAAGHTRSTGLHQTVHHACTADATLVVDAWAVSTAIARARGANLLGPDDGVATVLATGSVPSADGLRGLVDGCGAIDGAFSLVRRGRGGQLVVVEVGAAP